MKTRSEKRSFLRRYPALALVAVSALLAVLLPSALTVPQSGPTTLAEFAPVPGQGQGSSDISSLDSASSGGIGFGSGKGGSEGFTPPPEVGAPSQKKAQLKKCVGNPPRQTEDPLSPPCVAFFEGDNFGETWKGVTRDEVQAVLKVDSGSTDNRTGQLIDCARPLEDGDIAGDTYCRSYMRYFNDRYQTYGRRVHLWADHVAPMETIDQKKPFAAEGSFSWPARKTMALTYDGQLRRTYQSVAPYAIGVRHDIEDMGSIAASFICRKLNARPAKYAGPLLSGNPRKFGVWYNNGQQTTWLRDAVLAQLSDQCDLKIPSSRIVTGNTPASAGILQNEGVTSVIAIMTGQDPAVAVNLATQAGFFPEWVIPGGVSQRGLDVNANGRLVEPTQWSRAFGLTFDYRRDAIADQPWNRAYREACGECPALNTATGSAAPYDYEILQMLFWGIQAAGPRLTPVNLDKGLHAIPPKASTNPYQPAAYFAPGNYTFIKDASAIWWDPQGRAPGSTSTGCYRLPDGGTRRRTGEWPSGDDDLFKPETAPCQGDTFQ